MFKKAGGLPKPIVQVVSLDLNIVYLGEQIRLPITYQRIESDYRGEKAIIDLRVLLPLLKIPYHSGNLTRRQYSVKIAETLKVYQRPVSCAC